VANLKADEIVPIPVSPSQLPWGDQPDPLSMVVGAPPGAPAAFYEEPSTIVKSGLLKTNETFGLSG